MTCGASCRWSSHGNSSAGPVWQPWLGSYRSRSSLSVTNISRHDAGAGQGEGEGEGGVVVVVVGEEALRAGCSILTSTVIQRMKRQTMKTREGGGKGVRKGASQEGGAAASREGRKRRWGLVQPRRRPRW